MYVIFRLKTLIVMPRVLFRLQNVPDRPLRCRSISCHKLRFVRFQYFSHWLLYHLVILTACNYYLIIFKSGPHLYFSFFLFQLRYCCSYIWIMTVETISPLFLTFLTVWSLTTWECLIKWVLCFRTAQLKSRSHLLLSRQMLNKLLLNVMPTNIFQY